MTFQEAWGDRVADDLDGVPVHLTSKGMLIRNKRASGRPKGIADLRMLEDKSGTGSGREGE
jgi:hypothetical protein